MDRLNRSNISKIFFTFSFPVFLITGYLAVTEAFELLLEVFNEDFWRLLTTF